MRIPKPNPKLICSDGTIFSVQARWGIFCLPDDTNDGPFTHFEVSRPINFQNYFEMDKSWEPYQDDKNDDFCVYCRVPLQMIQQFIEQHGGLVSGKIPINGSDSA